MELQDIKNKIISVQEQQIILDYDVADLYGVETKRINEAVKNNPDKFPVGYIVYLTGEEFDDLRSKISTTKLNKTRVASKGFTERGLYMLATILKSPIATETTIAIIETFAKIKELSYNISNIQEQTDKEEQKSLLKRSGEIISDILAPDFETTDTETTLELNLFVLGVKHTIKRKSKNNNQANK